VTTRTSDLALGLAVSQAAPLVATVATTSNATEQSRPAAQIVADAERAMEAAGNFHVLGFSMKAGRGHR
jgi:hypothetical protein